MVFPLPIQIPRAIRPTPCHRQDRMACNGSCPKRCHWRAHPAAFHREKPEPLLQQTHPSHLDHDHHGHRHRDVDLDVRSPHGCRRRLKITRDSPNRRWDFHPLGRVCPLCSFQIKHPPHDLDDKPVCPFNDHYLRDGSRSRSRKASRRDGSRHYSC